MRRNIKTLVLWGFHPAHGNTPLKLDNYSAAEQRRREKEGWTCAAYAVGDEPTGLAAQAATVREGRSIIENWNIIRKRAPTLSDIEVTPTPMTTTRKAVDFATLDMSQIRQLVVVSVTAMTLPSAIRVASLIERVILESGLEAERVGFESDPNPIEGNPLVEIVPRVPTPIVDFTKEEN